VIALETVRKTDLPAMSMGLLIVAGVRAMSLIWENNARATVTTSGLEMKVLAAQAQTLQFAAAMGCAKRASVCARSGRIQMNGTLECTASATILIAHTITAGMMLKDVTNKDAILFSIFILLKCEKDCGLKYNNFHLTECVEVMGSVSVESAFVTPNGSAMTAPAP